MAVRAPQRRCLGCSAVRPQGQMLRLARDPAGRMAFDVARRLPGRGAWVCPRPDCLAAALKARRLAWAFRRETSPMTLEEALEQLRGLFGRRLLDLLGLARRAGALVSGHDEVARALESREAALLILARDLSERTRSDLVRRAGGATMLEMGTLGTLGPAVGQPGRGAMAVTNASMARAIRESYDQSASLGLSI